MPRILLVEDDTAVRLVFIELLFDAGYQVDATDTVKTGAAILDSGAAFDLLLTDSGLPDGNGITLADKARARGIPALIASGRPLDLDPRQYTMLMKPMRTAELLAAIAAALSRDG